MWLLFWVAQATAHQLGVHMTNVSAGYWACGCLVRLLGALFRRLMAVPKEIRLVVLTGQVIAHASFSPAHSVLGQPYETLLVAAALLMGEMVSHPFELRRRAAFAREALAAGMVPDAATDAAATRLVDPLTLSFSDVSLERAYTDRAFTEARLRLASDMRPSMRLPCGHHVATM